jgi:hypothetical protein
MSVTPFHKLCVQLTDISGFYDFLFLTQEVSSPACVFKVRITILLLHFNIRPRFQISAALNRSSSSLLRRSTSSLILSASQFAAQQAQKMWRILSQNSPLPSPSQDTVSRTNKSVHSWTMCWPPLLVDIYLHPSDITTFPFSANVQL